jgi:hypothetical protein
MPDKMSHRHRVNLGRMSIRNFTEKICRDNCESGCAGNLTRVSDTKLNPTYSSHPRILFRNPNGRRIRINRDNFFLAELLRRDGLSVNRLAKL